MMNKYLEVPSLLEVREWKEQCRQENSQLTQAKYLEKSRNERTISSQFTHSKKDLIK